MLGHRLLKVWARILFITVVCENLHPRCCPGGWKLVLAGGRFTTAAESHYSPVEGECLAVADSLHKARHFVLGCPDLIIAVDHKPLLGLLNDRSLADVQNPRLLSLKEKTLWFTFTVIHIPGRMHCGPDYMSRHGSQATTESGLTKEARQYCILAIISGMEGIRGDQESELEKGLVTSTIHALESDNRLEAITFERVKEE